MGAGYSRIADAFLFGSQSWRHHVPRGSWPFPGGREIPDMVWLEYPSDSRLGGTGRSNSPLPVSRNRPDVLCPSPRGTGNLCRQDLLQALTNDPVFRAAVREAMIPEVQAAILRELRESRKTQELTLACIEKMAGDVGRMATDIGRLVGDSLEGKMG